MIHDNVRDLRAILREAAIVLDTHDPALAKRLWAAHDALTVADLQKASTAPVPAHSNHPAIPDGSDTLTPLDKMRDVQALRAAVLASRDDRRDHDRHPPRPI